MVREDFVNNIRKGDISRILYEYFLEKGGTPIPYPVFQQFLSVWRMQQAAYMDPIPDLIKALSAEYNVVVLYDRNNAILSVS